ncbi:hypothetical protein DB30_02877 [Enhygromyxa salina]|uniref:Uncharacterized protein n=1 Tax=Enhygromyxa salina TaxID=215803 RepID=A0A0C1ZLM3_9BACT|nr:hypothetical protein DB30_02877 [Enhygromyxa salina]
MLDGLGDGDGDGDTGETGDGDGDTGDGDGDGDTGDGDGDTGDGDGDTGDGDGDSGLCGNDPGWGTVAIGQPVKHVAGKDHLGNAINLCEWGGTPIALDVAAVWCDPCRQASAYLATGAGNDPFSGLGPQLRGMIDSGKLVWITALVEDATSGPGAVADAAAWDSQYHHDNIPVIAEDDVPMLSGYVMNACVPAVYVLDQELNFFGIDDCQTWNQLAAAVEAFGG